MNKTVLFAVGGLVSLAALLTMFLQDDIDMPSAAITSVKEQRNTEQSPENVSISYDTKEVTAEPSKERVPKKKIVREKYLESKTYDSSKKFEIALINKNLQNPRKPGGYTTLQGTIDGESFFLKVPKALIEEGSGITELRVTNVKTNGVSTVSAAFIDDMRNPMVRQRITMDSDDIENLTQTEVEAIVPPRPGEAVQ